MVDSYSDMLLVPFAKYLTKYVKEWKLSDLGASILIPKEKYHFNSILFRPKRLSFAVDKSWEFIASVPIIESNDFSESHVSLFQHLKGIECETSRKGLLRKRFLMITSPILMQLQNEIPGLRIDDSLIEVLNQDDSFQKLLSTITPDNLSIKLFSQPIATRNLKEYCREFRDIYQNPQEIIWNISVEKYLESIVSKGKYTTILDSIVEILDVVSLHLQRVTQIIERRV